MSDEFCDDGNLGGCLANCAGPTPGYSCLGGNPILPDTCYEVCGNDILTPSEQCEDNDIGSLNLDGCSTTCTIEPGWDCNTLFDNPAAPFDRTICQPICGDGKNV